MKRILLKFLFIDTAEAVLVEEHPQTLDYVRLTLHTHTHTHTTHTHNTHVHVCTNTHIYTCMYYTHERSSSTELWANLSKMVRRIFFLRA